MQIELKNEEIKKHIELKNEETLKMIKELTGLHNDQKVKIENKFEDLSKQIQESNEKQEQISALLVKMITNTCEESYDSQQDLKSSRDYKDP